MGRRSSAGAPLASVIIPCRNRTGILSETLRTLALQSCPAGTFEVVVVDHGSTDDVAAQVRGTSYPFELRHVRLESDGRFCPARPRNAGLAHGRGELAILLDVDVLCSPGFVIAHISTHRETSHPRAVIGYTYGFPADPARRT